MTAQRRPRRTHRPSEISIGSLLLPANPQEPLQVRPIPADALEAAIVQKALVHGPTKGVLLAHPGASMVVNARLRAPAAPLNARANVLAQVHWEHPVSGRRESGRTIVGPALLLGQPSSSGIPAAVPEHFQHLFAHEGQFKVQVATHDEPATWKNGAQRYPDVFQAYSAALALRERWTRAARVRVVPATEFSTLSDWAAIGNQNLPGALRRVPSRTLNAHAIIGCYSLVELEQQIYETPPQAGTAFHYQDLCLVNRHAQQEDWIGIRLQEAFELPALQKAVTEGSFSHLIRQVLKADRSRLQARRF